MTNPLITILPDPPTRSEGQSVFTTKADAFLAALPTFASEENTLATWMNTTAATVNSDALSASSSKDAAAVSATSAASAANFKGLWSTASGAGVIPSTYYHNGTYWQLLVPLANIATSEPGVTGDWAPARPFNANLNRILNPMLHLFGDNDLVVRSASALSSANVSARTYLDRYGILRYSGIDQLRMQDGGALIEGPRTNEVIWSQELDNAAWLKSSATVTANATAAPDLSATADKFVEGAINAAHIVYQSITFVPSNRYVYSVYVKAAERSECQMVLTSPATVYSLYFNMTTGVFSGVTANIERYSATALAGGWFRLAIVLTAGAGAGAGNVQVRTSLGGTTTYLGDGVSGIYLWGAQLEKSASASSYIATTSASVTRAGDNVTIPALDNAPDFRSALALAFSVNNLLTPFGATYYVLNMRPTQTTTNFTGLVVIREVAGTILFRWGDGVTSHDLRFVVSVDTLDLVLVYRGDTLEVWANGILRVSMPATILLTTDLSKNINFGRDSVGASANNFSAVYSNFRAYPFALSPDEIYLLSQVVI